MVQVAGGQGDEDCLKLMAWIDVSDFRRNMDFNSENIDFRVASEFSAVPQAETFKEKYEYHFNVGLNMGTTYYLESHYKRLKVGTLKF